MSGLYCGICQCTLNGTFKISEVFLCDYCGRVWTLLELLFSHSMWSENERLIPYC